jgi:hypothetical protein
MEMFLYIMNYDGDIYGVDTIFCGLSGYKLKYG